MFPGAALVVDPGTSLAELIIPSAIGTNSITAIFLNNHAQFAPVMGVTFPVQIDTDPIYTVPEVLSYISRAQNEFLVRVPSSYLLASQTVETGQITQQTPCTPIMIARVALSSKNVAISTLTRSSGSVIAITTGAHNLSAGAAFSVINPMPPILPALSNSSFAGAFQVASIISPTSFSYKQVASDATATGGFIGSFVRLYESTQESISQVTPNWRSHHGIPRSWFEDRVAVYQWGVDRLPDSNFPVELLFSIRDVDMLGQLDGFLVPDILVYLIKYKALQYCWSKDGEQRDMKRAQFCGMRFDRGVMAAQRWIAQVVASPLSMTQTSPSRNRAREARV